MFAYLVKHAALYQVTHPAWLGWLWFASLGGQNSRTYIRALLREVFIIWNLTLDWCGWLSLFLADDLPLRVAVGDVAPRDEPPPRGAPAQQRAQRGKEKEGNKKLELQRSHLLGRCGYLPFGLQKFISSPDGFLPVCTIFVAMTSLNASLEM